jgi:hypothetical protein
MGFDAKRKKKLAGQKAQHRNPQILRPGAKRQAVLAQQLAIERRQNNGRAASNGDKPSLLNDALEKRICDHLRRGASLADAAVMAGIGTKTIETWRGKGAENPDSRYGQFLEQTELAQIEWKTRMVKKTGEATDWKGAWKLLCSRFPLEFRNITSAELSGPDGSPLTMTAGTFNVVLELSNSNEGLETAPQFRIVE